MKGWRTILFNAAMMAVGSPDIVGLLPPKWAVPVMALGNIVLRAVTDTKIGRSQ